MTPDINNWLTDLGKAGDWISPTHGAAGRSVHFTHRMISDKQVSIILYRRGTALDPQLARVELTRIQPDKDIGPGAREMVANAVLFGYRDHPTITDFDGQVGDKFQLDGITFLLRLQEPETPGMYQFWLEVAE